MDGHITGRLSAEGAQCLSQICTSDPSTIDSVTRRVLISIVFPTAALAQSSGR
jgi:hypothetical protein